MSDYKPDPLSLLIGDTEYDVPISIQSYRMSNSTTQKFCSNHVIGIFSVNTQSQVVTFLFSRGTGESSVTGYVRQGTADYSILPGNAGSFNLNAGLESTYVLSKKLRFTIFRFDSEAY